MARARRAKARPARIVVPLVVVALLAVGGVVGATQGWFGSADRSTTTNTAPSESATEEMSAPETPSTSPSTTPSESASGSASDSTQPAGTSELKVCQDKVKAANRVLTAADVGVGHWSEHVQAQTDANAGKISTDKMEAIFKRTRLAGPDDVAAYQAAKKRYADESSSCDPVDEASAGIAADLSACNERRDAQRPVLDAAADAMTDWKSHLAAMQRSRMGHVHDAEGVWIKAWRAAPPHIKAYQKAVKGFDAADC